ncbi:MAG: hypothetical protein M0Z75_07320 [Nitrospiraceae bacterium]|nr:hypothetical protein [Nitrospiraceae bacterium]
MEKGATALVPLGCTGEHIHEDIRTAVKDAFGAEVTVIGRENCRWTGFDVERRQYAASDLIECLSPLRAAFERVLGVASADLSYPGVNHVFGLTDPESRISVISLFRFRAKGAPPGKIAQRAIKTAIHELGHSYGLRHCKDHRCVMFFSFNLADTDYKNREFCKSCMKEISSILKADARKRKEV